MKKFITRWLARWSAPTGATTSAAMSTPDCASVMRKLWDYVDAELPPQALHDIRVHLEMCKRCCPQYEFERSFLHAIAVRRRTHSDPARLRARLLDALQAKGLGEA